MAEQKIKASVIVCAYNEEKDIASGIDAILRQDFKDFELIIVDDASCDSTKGVIEKYSDSRIRYVRNNKNLGPAAARNIGISLSRGEYIFFTDADCIPLPNWITEGLRHLEAEGYIGVEGLTLPDKYLITASDRAVNSENSKYQTCNMAYKKSNLMSVSGFDEKLRVGEDLDLGLRIKKLGDIYLNRDMVALHKTKKWKFKPALLYEWRCGEGMVYIIKKHKLNISVIYPKQFFGLIFPPILLAYYACRSIDDFKALPLLYLRLLVLRLSIWAFALKNWIFII